MSGDSWWAAEPSGRDPSSGPRRLERTPVAVHLLPGGEGGRNQALPSPPSIISLPAGGGWLAAGALTCRGETGEGSLPPLLRRSTHFLHHLEGKKGWGVRRPSANQEPTASGRDPSSGPRRPVRTPVAVHLLPGGEGGRNQALPSPPSIISLPRGGGGSPRALLPAAARRVRGHSRPCFADRRISSTTWKGRKGGCPPHPRTRGQPLREETPHPVRDGWRERPSRSTFSPREKVGEIKRSRAPQVSFPSPRGRGWLAAGALTCRGETGEGSLPPLLRRSTHFLHHLEGKKGWGVRRPSANQEPTASGRDPSSGPRRPVRTPVAVHLLHPSTNQAPTAQPRRRGTPWRAPTYGPRRPHPLGAH